MNNNKNYQNGHQQLLENISQLQDLEKDLYKQLQINASQQDTSTPAKQMEIIKKINELSNIRISLLKTLNQTANTIQNNVATSRVDLVDQLTLLGVVEQQLNNAKQKINQSDNIKNDKLRMVEINTYYGKRYKAYSELMKLLIYISLFLLFLAILNKKELLPENISNALMIVVLVIGGYFFIRKLMDIIRRDNMDFDQYDWSSTTSSSSSMNQPSVLEYDINQFDKLESGAEAEVDDESTSMEEDVVNMSSRLGLGCVGAACCSDKMKYDTTTKKCVDNNDNNNENESFLTMSLINSDDSVTLQAIDNNVQGYSSDINFASV